jgi:hypothetical protein
MGKEKLKKLYVVGNDKFFGSAIRKEKGYFSFDEMYSAWKTWFDDHGYFMNEKGQTEKILSSGNELKIEWVAKRDITSYVRFHIAIYLWVRRLKNVSVEVEGKKEKIQKGDLYIGFKGYLEKDYKGLWKRYEFWRRMYDRYLVKWKLSAYEGKIWNETNDLIALTKKYCGMMPLKKE